MLEWLITSGRIADVILVIMAIEAIVTFIMLRRTGGLSACGGPLAGLAAGAALVLALRGALTGAEWLNITLFLTIGFAAHLAEIGLRKLR